MLYTEILKAGEKVYLCLVNIKLEMAIKQPNINIKHIIAYMALKLKRNARGGVINFGIIEYKCHLNQRTK